MNQLDPHTLFSIFEQGDEQVYKEHGMEDTLNNPFVLMGMVLKGLENFTLMDLMYTRHYGQDYKRVKPTIKHKYYNKLFSYLQRIDSTKFETIHRIGESFDREAVNSSLATLLIYYELIEEYEKCAVIKRYMDLLVQKEEKKVGYLI
jgi:hypothetical protein